MRAARLVASFRAAAAWGPASAVTRGQLEEELARSVSATVDSFAALLSSTKYGEGDGGVLPCLGTCSFERGSLSAGGLPRSWALPSADGAKLPHVKHRRMDNRC